MTMNAKTGQKILTHNSFLPGEGYEAVTPQLADPMQVRRNYHINKMEQDKGTGFVPKLIIILLALALFVTQKLIVVEITNNTSASIYVIGFVIFLAELPQLCSGIFLIRFRDKNQIDSGSFFSIFFGLGGKGSSIDFGSIFQLLIEIVDVSAWLVLFFYLPDFNLTTSIAFYFMGNLVPSITNLVNIFTNSARGSNGSSLDIVGLVIQIVAILAELLRLAGPFIFSNSETMLKNGLALVIFSILTSLKYVLHSLRLTNYTRNIVAKSGTLTLWTAIIRMSVVVIFLISFSFIETSRTSSDYNLWEALLAFGLIIIGPVLFGLVEIMTRLQSKWILLANVLTPAATSALIIWFDKAYFNDRIQDKDQDQIYWPMFVSGCLASIGLIPYLYNDIVNDPTDSETFNLYITTLNKSILIWNTFVYSNGMGSLDSAFIQNRRALDVLMEILVQDSEFDDDEDYDDDRGHRASKYRDTMREILNQTEPGLNNKMMNDLRSKTLRQIPGLPKNNINQPGVRKRNTKRFTALDNDLYERPSTQRNNTPYIGNLTTREKNIADNRIRAEKELLKNFKNHKFHLCIFDDNNSFYNSNTCKCQFGIKENEARAPCRCRLTKSYAWKALIRFIKAEQAHELFESINIMLNYKVAYNPIAEELEALGFPKGVPCNDYENESHIVFKKRYGNKEVRIDIHSADYSTTRINRRYMEAWALYNIMARNYVKSSNRHDKDQHNMNSSYLLFLDSFTYFDISGLSKLYVKQTWLMDSDQLQPNWMTMSNVDFVKGVNMMNLSPYTNPWKLVNMYDQIFTNMIERSIQTTFGTVHTLENEAICIIPMSLVQDGFMNSYLKEQNQPTGETLIYQNRYNDCYMALLFLEERYSIRYSSGCKALRPGLTRSGDWINYTSNKIFKDMLSRREFIQNFEKFIERNHPNINQIYGIYFNYSSWLRLLTGALILSLQASLVHKLIYKSFMVISFLVLLPYAIYTFAVLLSKRKSINGTIFYVVAGWTGLVNMLCLISVISQLTGGCGFCNLGSIQYLVVMILYLTTIIFQWLYDREQTSLLTVIMSYFWMFLLSPSYHITLPIYMFFKGKEGNFGETLKQSERAKYQVGFGRMASLDCFPYPKAGEDGSSSDEDVTREELQKLDVGRIRSSVRNTNKPKKKRRTSTITSIAHLSPDERLSNFLFGHQLHTCVDQKSHLWNNVNSVDEFSFQWFVVVLTSFMFFFSVSLLGLKTEAQCTFICMDNNDCKYTVYDRFVEALFLFPFTINKVFEVMVMISNWMNLVLENQM